MNDAAMNQADLVPLLNRLIVTAKDEASSLRAAGEKAYHADLKNALYECSQFFARSAEELQEAVRTLGGQPKEVGTFANTLYRTWLHLKMSALGRDEDKLLNEVESEEDLVEQKFGAAAHDAPDPQLRSLIERQFQTALHHHERISDLHRQIHTHRYSA